MAKERTNNNNNNIKKVGQEVLEGHGIRHVSGIVQTYAHNSSNR